LRSTRDHPELCEECLAREFCHRIQNHAQERGLNVTDRIAIPCAGPQPLVAALDKFRDYVCGETLAVFLRGNLTKAGAEANEIDEFKADVQIRVSGA